jgi:hypothetical protein
MRVLGWYGKGSVPARFCVINPPTFSAIPAKTSSVPNIHRIGPCTKLVGANHSSANKARMGKTNRSGGAIGTPGRSSSDGNSEGIGVNLIAKSLCAIRIQKRRAPSFPKAPFIFDGGKPNSVSLIAQAGTIIYLAPISRNARQPCSVPKGFGAATVTVMRRYPRIGGPAVLPLFCLAPHGVFPASRITARAVSSYLAFSPLPCTSLPKNRRCLFCDTFRRRNLATAAPAYFTRHAAVWCSDFPPASLAAYQRSSAIGVILPHRHTKEKRVLSTGDVRSITTTGRSGRSWAVGWPCVPAAAKSECIPVLPHGKIPADLLRTRAARRDDQTRPLAPRP